MREGGGGIFLPDLSAAAPRCTAIGYCRGHAESPIGQKASVEGPPRAHWLTGFKARFAGRAAEWGMLIGQGEGLWGGAGKSAPLIGLAW